MADGRTSLPESITREAILGQLGEGIARHATGRGVTTAVPRQVLVRQDGDADGIEVTYRPVLCFVARGTKALRAGPHTAQVGPGEMFLGILRLPATATFRAPYRSVMLDLDDGLVADMIAEVGPAPSAPPTTTPFTVTAMDEGLVDALGRWVGLLDEPRHIPVIAPRIEQEILYRVLTGPIGAGLRAIVAGGTMAAVRAAAELLTRDPFAPSSAQHLAAGIGISPATFYRRFRELTGMSPQRFHKEARLQLARRLLVTGEHTASAAASAVGYVSVQQFSRDYRQRYGRPPAQDAAALRTGQDRAPETTQQPIPLSRFGFTPS